MALFQVILLMFVLMAVVMCNPSDFDPTDIDGDENPSPSDPQSFILLKKLKLKKLLLGK